LEALPINAAALAEVPRKTRRVTPFFDFLFLEEFFIIIIH